MKQSKPAHARGDRIGRYVVVDTIGVGAMGTVHAAFDPELGRTVALKIVRPQAALRAGAHAMRMRLLREAQAMARVVHPNVVPIFDVGQHGDRLYLAMERIDGVNLRRWLARDPPSIPALLDVLVPAGHGLAAAHREGLVHRDFKPENVLVARDGRVCVTDFGLARPKASNLADASPRGSMAGILGVTLTHDGDRIGTPAYMAPELHRGEPAEPGSDLYAFCVVLYEGLHGHRPDETPSGSSTRTVPRRLRQVLRRGLNPDPRRRFESMDALLAELETFRQRRRVLLRRAGAGAVMLGALGFAFATIVDRGLGGSPCEAAEHVPDTAWGTSERARVRARFDRSAAPHAQASLLRTLDDWVASWRLASRDVCEATRTRGEQSPQLREARELCLRGAWSRLRHTVEMLAEADDDVLGNARTLVDALPAPDRCRAIVENPPADGIALRRWEDASEAVARADVLRLAGRRREAMASLHPIVAPLRELGPSTLLGEMLLVRARLELAAENTEEAAAALDEALRIARATHRLQLEAEVWIALAELPGTDQERRFCTRMARAAARAATNAASP